MLKANQHKGEPVPDALDEYDRHRNAEVLEDYAELFELLTQMHRRYPHWRFGQMVTNLAGWSGKTRPGNPYDVPDQCLVETARSHLAKRHAGAPAAPEDGSGG